MEHHDDPMESDWPEDHGDHGDEDIDLDPVEPDSMPEKSSGHYEEVYPDAGRIFGHGDNFMDEFDKDEHASERQTNPFYPFASKGEVQSFSPLILFDHGCTR